MDDHDDLRGEGHKDLEVVRLEVHACVCTEVVPTLEGIMVGSDVEDPAIAKAFATKATTIRIKFELEQERLHKETTVASRKTLQQMCTL